MQSQWKLFQLQWKTWGRSTCVRHFPSIRRFELTSVRRGVCRRLWYCDGLRSKIVHQDWNFKWQKPYRNSRCFTWSLWWAVDNSTVCGEQTVERSTVSCWATHFCEGRVTINDDPRPGKPKTSTDEQSVKLVVDFLAQDRQAMCEEVSQATKTSPTSVFHILTNDLQKRIICARWVPHCLTAEQKQKRLEIATLLKQRFNIEGPVLNCHCWQSVN